MKEFLRTLIKRFIRKDSVRVWLSAKDLVKLDICDPAIELDDSKIDFVCYLLKSSLLW